MTDDLKAAMQEAVEDGARALFRRRVLLQPIDDTRVAPQEVTAVAEGFRKGAMAALGCAHWDDADDFFTMVGIDYAQGKPFPPTMPKPRQEVTAGVAEEVLELEGVYEKNKPFHEMLMALRSEEGDSVTLFSDNPDFNSLPNNAIECCGEWTDWQDRRFTGDTLVAAVKSAYQAKRALLASNPDQGLKDGWRPDVGRAPEEAWVWGWRHDGPPTPIHLYGFVELVKRKDDDWFDSQDEPINAPVLWQPATIPAPPASPNRTEA